MSENSKRSERKMTESKEHENKKYVHQGLETQISKIYSRKRFIIKPIFWKNPLRKKRHRKIYPNC